MRDLFSRAGSQICQKLGHLGRDIRSQQGDEDRHDEHDQDYDQDVFDPYPGNLDSARWSIVAHFDPSALISAPEPALRISQARNL